MYQSNDNVLHHSDIQGRVSDQTWLSQRSDNATNARSYINHYPSLSYTSYCKAPVTLDTGNIVFLFFVMFVSNPIFHVFKGAERGVIRAWKLAVLDSWVGPRPSLILLRLFIIGKQDEKTSYKWQRLLFWNSVKTNPRHVSAFFRGIKTSVWFGGDIH